MGRQCCDGMGLGYVQVTLLALELHWAIAAALFHGHYHPPPFEPAAHFYPKPLAPLKLPSRALDDKFYFALSTKPKKPKYLVAKLNDGWKGVDFGHKQTFFDEPLGPAPVLRAFEPQDDVKPVTEHIEGDLMYDFRTNTHSI